MQVTGDAESPPMARSDACGHHLWPHFAPITDTHTTQAKPGKLAAIGSCHVFSDNFLDKVRARGDGTTHVAARPRAQTW